MEYEIPADEPVSCAVVRAVCAVEGQEPTGLRPLHDVLDPDALDRLFEPRPDGTPRLGGRVSLVVSDCRVTIDNGEYLTITPMENHRADREGRRGGREGPCPPRSR